MCLWYNLIYLNSDSNGRKPFSGEMGEVSFRMRYNICKVYYNLSFQAKLETSIHPSSVALLE